MASRYSLVAEFNSVRSGDRGLMESILLGGRDGTLTCGPTGRLDPMAPKTKKKRPKLLLLDGYSLAFRAFYALPEDLQTTDGTFTNAVYGFTSMLIKLMQEQKPDLIATCLDMGAP